MTRRKNAREAKAKEVTDGEVESILEGRREVNVTHGWKIKFFFVSVALLLGFAFL